MLDSKTGRKGALERFLFFGIRKKCFWTWSAALSVFRDSFLDETLSSTSLASEFDSGFTRILTLIPARFD